MWNLKQNKTKQMEKKQNRNGLLDTKNKLMVARGEVGRGTGEEGKGKSRINFQL